MVDMDTAEKTITRSALPEATKKVLRDSIRRGRRQQHTMSIVLNSALGNVDETSNRFEGVIPGFDKYRLLSMHIQGHDSAFALGATPPKIRMLRGSLPVEEIDVPIAAGTADLRDDFTEYSVTTGGGAPFISWIGGGSTVNGGCTVTFTYEAYD